MSKSLYGPDGIDESILGPESDLFDRLEKLAGKPMKDKTYWIVRTKKGDYVCGVPYDTTAFAERAFAFADVSDADAIIQDFFPDGQAIKCGG